MGSYLVRALNRQGRRGAAASAEEEWDDGGGGVGGSGKRRNEIHVALRWKRREGEG